jgi:adenylate cyclase
MAANRSVAHRLGRVLEAVTRQSGRLSTTPEYGSWVLGKVSDTQLHRRVRIQVILTCLILLTNLLGIAVATLLVAFVFPTPSVFGDAPRWLTLLVSPGYIALAVGGGAFWVTRRIVNSLRWAIEERKPDRTNQYDTFVAPWRVARMVLVLWAVGAVLLTSLYGLHATEFIPRFLFAVTFSGIVVATACYLITEFALRPVAARTR